MKQAVSCQLPIMWCISICMDKVKLSVSTTGNKPAVSATKRRQMAHGNAKPLTAKVWSLSNQLSRRVPLLCMQTQTACNQTKSVSLQVRRTKQNTLSWESNRFDKVLIWEKSRPYQVRSMWSIAMARPKKKLLNGTKQTIAVPAKSV